MLLLLGAMPTGYFAGGMPEGNSIVCHDFMDTACALA
jgi:hypothetical protein